MPLKLCGALLLTAAGLCGGRLSVRRLRLRRDFLTELLLFLSNLSTAVRYRNDDIYLLINASSDLFQLDADASSAPFGETWCDAVKRLHAQWRFSARDRKLLEAFGMRLGTTDTQGQLAHIELYRTLFQKQLTQAKEELAQKARLYQTLGLFAGVAAALTLW